MEGAEAAVRRRAFEQFLKLKSMGAVAREMNAAGLVTRRGGKWTDVQVARILECPSAIGTYEIGRSEADDSGQRRKTGTRERSTVECEPIVTRETWEKVAALIAGKRATRAAERDDEKAPLTGLVWCRCGQRMRVPTGSGKFACPKCSSQISAADLEAIFAEDFAEVVATHPALAGAMEGPSERRELMVEIAGLDGELEDAVRQRAGVERIHVGNHGRGNLHVHLGSDPAVARPAAPGSVAAALLPRRRSTGSGQKGRKLFEPLRARCLRCRETRSL
jgi:hypothetical protein